MATESHRGRSGTEDGGVGLKAGLPTWTSLSAAMYGARGRVFPGRGTHHAVEAGAFVALGPPLGVLGLAGAELAEVFRGFGDDVGEEFHLDAAEGFACGLFSEPF
jgi:hypothetical protein